MEYKRFITDSINSASVNSESENQAFARSASEIFEIHQKTFSKYLEEEIENTISESSYILNKPKIRYYGGGPKLITTKEVELSSYRLDGIGITDERVIRTQNISAQIIEVTNDFVVLECLIDESQRIYQNRSIRKEILEDIVPLHLGQLILIKMKDLKGGNSIQYIDGNGIISKEDFNSDIFFEGLDNSFIDFQN